ncbi:MAG: ATP-dependent zinc metalloprotease FtsH [Proteobacteria bacterium]|nr:ATP-dependent zinc metalloprotease FtsH [Pseudomonadota bacterium]MBU4296476.1 ATP-dependent zinc metalloprotease FtsH [Pseudomonadota bacterium]MCG2749658.1 ATP-dependent zinc metalloprotease FtsH [Desulfobulbaceae bacterium]
MKYFYKNLSIWLIIGLIGIVLINVFKKPPDDVIHVNYTDFLKRIEQGVIPDIKLEGNVITWTNSNGESFKTVSPENQAVIAPLLKSRVNIEVREPKKPHWFLQIFLSWVPFLLIIFLWFFFTKQGGEKGGGGKAMAFGKSRARLIDPQESKITFKDVAGVDEAKDELVEIVDFLKDPSRFSDAGARIPKGVLLYGEPGTGKTLLAKAIAGEAGVPFFSISGSNFVEMYVGIGASRVRDLFKEGKKKAPCIIFIDEIDAVGRHRSAGGGGGGNDEREQTLNQLLVEMDGFEGNEGVIIIAATNRQDILDPALLRPGRFDRQVMVPLPDVGGREHILKVHAKKIQVDIDVNWKIIAKGTPGFSGAELANMVNEAALMVARKGDGGKVTMDIIEKAKDKVMMGAERRSLIITDKEKKITAFHESGHALTAWMLPGADPVHKVTIIPRGKALGLTMQLPEEDKLSHSKSYLFNNLCILLGGRIAEEIAFGDITTGAGNDIDRVSDLARKMVCEWGMSEEIGTITFKAASPVPGNPGPIISEATALKIDGAVKNLVNSAYDTSKKILSDNRKILDAMTQALLDHETITTEDIKKIVKENS